MILIRSLIAANCSIEFNTPTVDEDCLIDRDFFLYFSTVPNYAIILEIN